MAMSEEAQQIIGPRHGRRAAIVVLIMSFAAVALGLVYLATHPRRAPLNSR